MLALRKAPADQLDYDVEFERWLSDGDSVQSADAVTSTIENDAAPLIIESVQLFGTIVKVWISGGTAGESYDTKVTATTAKGRVKEVCFIIRVAEC